MMRKILIPMAIAPDGASPDTIHTAKETYLRKLTSVGLLPVCMPVTLPKHAIDLLYEECDGIFLMGGDDIAPHYYGAHDDEHQHVADPRRDAVEIALVKRALADKKPFLGICRGCQVLAVASGGTLVQHIPKTFGVDHRPARLGSDVPRGIEQTIHLQAGTRLQNIVEKNTVRVLCNHHQAIHSVGHALRICAMQGSMAEAIEAIDSEHFCLGIQSHPERLEQSDLEPVFAAFADAVNAR